jgi:hypothetical protein
VVTWLRRGAARIARSDSPARSRMSRERSSMASIRSSALRAVRRKGARIRPSSAARRVAVRMKPDPAGEMAPSSTALRPSRTATSRASSPSRGVSGSLPMRSSAPRTRGSGTRVRIGDEARSVRSAPVTVALRAGSAVVLPKSARRMRSPSSMAPWATREATGPIPATRMTKYPVTATPRRAKAATPPRSAFLQVRWRWRKDGEGAASGRGPGGVEPGVPGPVSSMGSVRPSPPGPRAGSGTGPGSGDGAAPGAPSCTRAVATTMGSPTTRRESAEGATQSGSPAVRVRASTTWRATQEPAR